jgi:hypothetical protein
MGLKLVRVLSVQSVYFCKCGIGRETSSLQFCYELEAFLLHNFREAAVFTPSHSAKERWPHRCKVCRTSYITNILYKTCTPRLFLLRFLYPMVFSNSRTGYRVRSPTEHVVHPSSHSSYRSVCEKSTELMLVHAGVFSGGKLSMYPAER